MFDQHDLSSRETAGVVGVETSSAGWTSGDSAPARLTDDVSCLATRDGKVSWVLVTNGTFKTFLQLGH